MLLSAHKTDPVIVGHTACIIKNLSLSKNRQVGTQNPSLGGHIKSALPTERVYVLNGTYAKDTPQGKVLMKVRNV